MNDKSIHKSETQFKILMYCKAETQNILFLQVIYSFKVLEMHLENALKVLEFDMGKGVGTLDFSAIN